MSLTMKSFPSDTSVPYQVGMKNATIKTVVSKTIRNNKNTYFCKKKIPEPEAKATYEKKLQYNNYNMRRVNAKEVKRVDTSDF